MKTSLDHLPEDKREELAHVVAVLKKEFAKELAKGQERWRRKGKILKIILYGSFARGDWVDEPENGYQSDWDLLVVVNNQKLAEGLGAWEDAEDRLLADLAVHRVVNTIVHSKTQANDALREGSYFWTDLVKDGVLAFEQSPYPMATPRPLTPAEAYEKAKKYFDRYSRSLPKWLTTAKEMRAKTADDEDWANMSAFNLHQSVETAYACFLLVHTLYLPHSHNIKFLRSLSEALDRRLFRAWPRKTKREDSRFKLLKRAYVEARYSEHYTISVEDLDLLIACAGELIQLVDETCRERLEELRAKVS